MVSVLSHPSSAMLCGILSHRLMYDAARYASPHDEWDDAAAADDADAAHDAGPGYAPEAPGCL